MIFFFHFTPPLPANRWECSERRFTRRSILETVYSCNERYRILALWTSFFAVTFFRFNYTTSVFRLVSKPGRESRDGNNRTRCWQCGRKRAAYIVSPSRARGPCAFVSGLKVKLLQHSIGGLECADIQSDNKRQRTLNHSQTKLTKFSVSLSRRSFRAPFVRLLYAQHLV